MDGKTDSVNSVKRRQKLSNLKETFPSKTKLKIFNSKNFSKQKINKYSLFTFQNRPERRKYDK